MGFWGIELKPGKPHPYHSDNVQGRLYVTQATLGLGSSKERCILQCSVGHKSQIFLCSLLPDKIESCSLNLEFKDELVAFSVIGTRSIHVSGYFVSDEEGDYLRDEYESDSGEDIADTESDESSEYDYDDELDDHFIVDDDDDIEMFPPSPVPKSSVVIEEITDNDKPANDRPANGDGSQFNQQKKKNQSHDHVGQQQMVVSGRGTGVSVLESEDEDGFPISVSQKSEASDGEQQDELNDKRATKETKKKKKREYDGDASAKKRKVTRTGQDDQPESRSKKKKEKKKHKEKAKNIKTDEIDDDQANEIAKDEIQPEESKKQDFSDGNNHDKRGVDADGVAGESSSDKKRKKKKNKKKIQDPVEGENKDRTAAAVENETQSLLEPVEKESVAKSSHIRTFANGLVIEELAMGKPDGKRASPGNRVAVHYIGKLQKNGKIFDSNVGRKPFEFRLGVGQVIKGWDVGVNGMRVGDKRRLIIPPSMGYGDKPVGGKIPPNSWLVFDVELVNVR